MQKQMKNSPLITLRRVFAALKGCVREKGKRGGEKGEETEVLERRGRGGERRGKRREGEGEERGK